MDSSACRALQNGDSNEHIFRGLKFFGSKFQRAWNYLFRFCKLIAKMNVEVKNFVEIYYKMFIDLSVDSSFYVTEVKPTQTDKAQQATLTTVYPDCLPLRRATLNSALQQDEQRITSTVLCLLWMKRLDYKNDS